MSTYRDVARKYSLRKIVFCPLRQSRAFSNATKKHTRFTSATAADLRLTDSHPTGLLLLQAAGRAQRVLEFFLLATILIILIHQSSLRIFLQYMTQYEA